MGENQRKKIVLTPVKNEAWILPLFCKSASIWADYIIIADQGSTDGSREILRKFPKVVLIENDSADLDESYRDKLLIEKARELVGCNSVLFRIDADEIFSPNFNSPEWNEILQSSAGSFWRFKWLQLYPGFKTYWENGTVFGAYVDDGRAYTGHEIIHNREFFKIEGENKIYIAREIGLLHFQFVDWSRMQSKHRYYQCFEHIKFPNKSVIEIYRTYHWMYNNNLPKMEVPNKWIEAYSNSNIDITDITIEKKYWWDYKVEEYFKEYTPKYFRYIETYYPGQLMTAKGKNILDKLFLEYLNLTKIIFNNGHGMLYKIVKKTDSLFLRIFHL